MLSILGAAVQACSLCLFIQAGKSDSPAVGKSVIMGAFVVGMVIIFWLAVGSSHFTRIAFFCCGQTVAGVMAMQSFAFLAYPGLAKDLDFVSLANLELVCRQTFTILLIYSGLSLLLVIVRRGLIKFQSHPTEK